MTPGAAWRLAHPDEVPVLRAKDDCRRHDLPDSALQGLQAKSRNSRITAQKQGIGHGNIRARGGGETANGTSPIIADGQSITGTRSSDRLSQPLDFNRAFEGATSRLAYCSPERTCRLQASP